MKHHNLNNQTGSDNTNAKQMITDEISLLDSFSAIILIVFMLSAYLLLCSYDLKSDNSIIDSSVQHVKSITNQNITINP